MRNLVLAAAALVALAVGAFASPSPPPDDATPSKAMKAFTDLKAEWDKAFKDYWSAYNAAKTDAERRKTGDLRPKGVEWSPRFKAIAAKYPSDPVAGDCFAWIAANDHTPATQQGALDALIAKYITSPACASVCRTLEYSEVGNADAFLRDVVDKNKDHESLGWGCYTLARRLSDGGESSNRTKEAESLFERVVAEFADLKNGKYSLADLAKNDLFEIRSLAVGKTAPEIAGADENGKALKLSDFRGKVVLLDFWGFW